MRLLMLACAVATLPLGGCMKADETFASGENQRGRYAGVGLYLAGRMWEQMARATQPSNAAAAKLQDDEHVIVVVDSKTGEVRQCGDLSGFCISMNPWEGALPASQRTPMALTKHASDLDREAQAASEAQAAASSARR